MYLKLKSHDQSSIYGKSKFRKAFVLENRIKNSYLNHLADILGLKTKDNEIKKLENWNFAKSNINNIFNELISYKIKPIRKRSDLHY